MEKLSTRSKDRLRNWLLLIGLIFAVLAIFYGDLDAHTNTLPQPAAKEVVPATSELQSNSSMVSTAVCKIQTVVFKIGKGLESNS